MIVNVLRFLHFSAFLGMKSAIGNIYLNSSFMNSPASNQLESWSLNSSPGVELVSGSGSPVDDLENSLTVGPNGPILLQDYTFFDQLQAFDRERIPERVVHAKGAGAHGYLEVTNDITSYTSAKIFANVPSQTPVLVRFSKVSGESGSADSTRDTRGFAIKFFTQEGVWDLVCNNSPVFFIRDALRFPNLIHSIRRNPQTHLMDPNMLWDFMSLVPETTFQLLIMFSDQGIPDGYRHMNGYSINTFTLVSSLGELTYARFHLRTNQGIQNLSDEEGLNLTASDPDYFIRDLYNAIGSGEFPSWNFSVQLMTIEQAGQFQWNPFDPTKLWPESEFPLVQIGVLHLNKNPVNYFAEVEMAAFSPRRLVPGIEPTMDRVLQGRLFSYADAQSYRLGTNYLLGEANRPRNLGDYYNYQRDGYARCGDDEGNAVNYFPNSFNGPQVNKRGSSPRFNLSGLVGRYNSLNEDNFSQPAYYWNTSLSEGERERIVMNLAASLSQAIPKIQARALENFSNVSEDLGQRLATALSELNNPSTST